jgi:nicotinamidase-related amidase
MKTIFVNINTQVDFFEKGKFKQPESESIKPKLKALTDFAKEKNIKVVNIVSWFDLKNKSLSKTPDYNTTFPEHCIMNTEGTNFIKETTPSDSIFLIQPDSPYIIFPEIHKHRNLVILKTELNLIEGNKFANSVLNNLGITIMDRPSYVLYGIGVNLIAKDLTRMGYSVRVISDALCDFNNNISYEEIGVEKITTEEIFSSELI